MVMMGFPGGFTVLISVYANDSPSLFRRSVESIFANTLQPDAVVLVVDGPVPAPLDVEIVKLELEFEITILRLEANVGLAEALNRGLELVQTDWILRADADDYNFPDRFEKMAVTLAAKSNALDLFGAAILEVDEDGKDVSVRRTVSGPEEIKRMCLKRNPFNHMTVAMRSTMVRKVGGYPAIPLKEDYALWISLLSINARVLNIPDVLVKATAGRSMYARRGGFRYAKSELALQSHMVSCGLKSFPNAIFHGLLRGLVFILPSFLRSKIYVHCLRDGLM